MSFGIANFDSLPDNVKLAFEDLEAWANAFLLKEHNSDGTHKSVLAQVDSTLSPTEQVEETHHWYRGPFTFDQVGVLSGTIGLRLGGISPGTYHDYAPTGIDTSMIVELSPNAGDLVLTGLRQSERIKRLLILGNFNDADKTITLKHENTGSVASNRFKLPDATDIVLAEGQYVWLFYDIFFSRWRAFVTGQQSGNLALLGGSVLTATLTPSDAQIDAMNATPVQIVAAPGAGLTLIPFWWSLRGTKAVNPWSTTSSFRLRYTGIATDLTNNIAALLTTAGANTIAISTGAVAYSFNVATGSTDPANLGLEISLAADVTQGTGGATAYTFEVAYYVLG